MFFERFQPWSTDNAWIRKNFIRIFRHFTVNRWKCDYNNVESTNESKPNTIRRGINKKNSLKMKFFKDLPRASESIWDCQSDKLVEAKIRNRWSATENFLLDYDKQTTTEETKWVEMEKLIWRFTWHMETKTRKILEFPEEISQIFYFLSWWRKFLYEFKQHEPKKIITKIQDKFSANKFIPFNRKQLAAFL